VKTQTFARSATRTWVLSRRR